MNIDLIVFAIIFLALVLIPGLCERAVYRNYILQFLTGVMATVAVLAVAGLIIKIILPKADWIDLYFSILAGAPVCFLGCVGTSYLRRRMAWNVRNDSPNGWTNRMIINQNLTIAVFILAFACGATVHWALGTLG